MPLLNCLGLLLMWALFARDYTPRQWLSIVLGSIAAIDAGLWLWDSTVRWYVGSSGVLHGVMAAGTLAHLRRRESEGWMLAAFLVGKLVWEQGRAHCRSRAVTRWSWTRTSMAWRAGSRPRRS